MLASSSQLASARCANPPSLAALRAGALALHHGRQQARGFRFGRLWATYWAEGESHRDDIYRRPRCFRYKYTKSLDSTIEAGKESPSETRKSLAGHHLHGYWGIHNAHSHARFEKEYPLSQLPDNPEGVRPGRNIEDVERAPLEDLLFGRSIDTWQSSYTKIRNQRWLTSAKTKRANSSAASQPGADAGSSVEPQYTIDPITNRKVPQVDPSTNRAAPGDGLDTPHNAFSTYKPQFSSLVAPSLEPDHVRSFAKGTAGRVDAGGSDASKGHPVFDAAALPRQPILESEQYVAEVNETPVSDLLGTLNARHHDVSWHRGDGIVPPSRAPEPVCVSNNASTYPDLEKYRTVEDPEPLFPTGESAEQQYVEKEYDAVRYRKPDGKTASDEAKPEYDDLAKYGAFRAHEPDGMYKQGLQQSVDPQELKQYQPYRSHEPDGKYAAAYKNAEIEASELEQYSKPYLSHEPDGTYAQGGEIKAEDGELPRYQAFRSHEPDGKYAHGASAPMHSAEELGSYTPVRSHEPDGKYAERTSPEPTPGDLGQYTSFRSHEPDGKYAAEAEASIEPSDSANHEAFGYEESETGQVPADEPVYDPGELGKYDAARYNEPDGEPSTDAGLEVYDDAELEKYRAIKLDDTSGHQQPNRSHFRQMLEQCMSEAAAESDAVDADTKMSLRKSKELFGDGSRHGNTGLTGKYTRDFPEEFTRSWSAENSDSKSSLAPSDMDHLQAHEQVAQPTATSTGALQPALERQLSSEKLDTSLREASETAGTNSPTPVVYKVLVYDPVMQCIDTAETTSVVPDTATPLTPAEVLLRISNPSRFLPHFAPLAKLGFEIVSGAGDVLVFRKVRDATPEVAAQTTVTETTTDSVLSSRPAVNPIDMTGGSRYTIAAERFASPTGFVNYDLPQPRFHSRIDVRREEAVFSGPKSETGEKKKASITKRVAIGALWAGGLTYSAGVLAEYFQTGGQDGKGPKRL
ncbi:hypothetical protein OQA88_7151 [Cercophora sp. LCS_1]